MEVFLILLTVAVIGAIYVMVASKWKTVITATGTEAEELQAKYAFLKEQKIRCRLRTESSMAVGVAPGMNPEASQVTKLLVKEQDIARVIKLLDQYDRETKRLF